MSHLECQVCLERYDSVDHCPRLLTCGHSICTSCLGGLLKDVKLICPQCRTPYRGQVNSVNDVPVVYDLLPLLQESSREKFHPDVIFKSLKKESTDTTSVKTLALEEQIKSLRAQLSALNGQAEVNNKVTKEIIEQLHKNKEMVLNEIDYVKEAIDIALAAKESVMDSLQAAKDATTLGDLFPVHEEAKRCCESSEKSLQRNQMLLQRKVLENSQKAHSEYESFLEKGNGQMEEESKAEPLLAQPLEKPKMLVGAFTQAMAKEALAKGKVWAVTTWKGRPRRAQISQEGNRLLLHALQDGEPSAGSTVVEYEIVRQFQDKQYTRSFTLADGIGHSHKQTVREMIKVFLELSWENERRGKVWIQTTGTDVLNHLFRHLCLGDLGPSYVNTWLEGKDIDCSGWVNVTGGEGKNNSERKYLIRNLKTGLCSPNLKHFTRHQGSVEMDPYNPHKFSIYTYNTISDECPSKNNVGHVYEGLPLVDETFDLPNIKDVKITDCGSEISPPI